MLQAKPVAAPLGSGDQCMKLVISYQDLAKLFVFAVEKNHTARYYNCLGTLSGHKLS